MNTHDQHPPAESVDLRWQFGLRTLLGITITTAVALTMLVSLPDEYAGPGLVFLAVAVPAILTVAAIYGSGYQRTFCIGALFPACLVLYATGWLLGLSLVEPPIAGRVENLEDWFEFFEKIAPVYRLYVGAAWILAVILGALAVLARWRLEQGATKRP